MEVADTVRPFDHGTVSTIFIGEKMFYSKILLSDLHSLGNSELVHLMDSFSFRKWYSVMLDSTIF